MLVTEELVRFLPEFLLLIFALAVLMLGVFGFAKSRNLPTFSSFLLLGLAIFMLFNGLNSAVVWLKALILLFAIAAIYLCKFSIGQVQFEYIALVIFSSLAGFVTISASDFLTLFMGLELQSLVAYILTGIFQSGKAKGFGAEAGIKYFSLGGLATCLLLFGISLIYAVSGSIEYNSLPAGRLEVIAAGLILLSFLFKLAAAPMHMWAPDVYQGSSIFSLNIFASINKFSALVGLNNLLAYVFNDPDLLAMLDQILIGSMVLSLLVGALGALMQTNFKRFIAYSGIFDIAYVLLCLICHNYQLSLVYLLIYIVNLLALIGFATYAKPDNEQLELENFAGLLKTNRFTGASLVFCLFSIMGMPPLLGFVGKYCVIVEAFAQGRILLAFATVLMTVISSYYYLRIIKTIAIEN